MFANQISCFQTFFVSLDLLKCLFFKKAPVSVKIPKNQTVLYPDSSGCLKTGLVQISDILQQMSKNRTFRLKNRTKFCSIFERSVCCHFVRFARLDRFTYIYIFYIYKTERSKIGTNRTKKCSDFENRTLFEPNKTGYVRNPNVRISDVYFTVNV